jgi:Tol biopolymer transport system component
MEMTAMTGSEMPAEMSETTIGPSVGSAPEPVMEGGAEASRLSDWPGGQRKEFEDPEGRSVCQLTDSRLESKHTYYDICPWSPDGRLVVFSSADPEDLTKEHRDNLSAQNGLVRVVDMQTFETQVIAEGAFYTSHNGAFPMWHPIRNTAYYRIGPEEIGAIDLDSGRRWTMSGVLRQLSPDGAKFASQLNPEDRPEDPEAWGFYTMNEDGSGLRRIVSIEQLYELTPNRDEFSVGDMTVGNPKWSPDSQHLLLTMWVRPKPQVRRSLYIANRDASQLRWLTHFSDHHSWTPDGKRVLFNDWKAVPAGGGRQDRRIFLVDFDGSNRTAVIDEPAGSHPCMDPAGTRIADCDQNGVYVVRVREQRIDRVATFRDRFDMSHRGTHPHCLWSPDGRQVLYNSAETGHSELYLVHVDA